MVSGAGGGCYLEGEGEGGSRLCALPDSSDLFDSGISDIIDIIDILKYMIVQQVKDKFLRKSRNSERLAQGARSFGRAHWRRHRCVPCSVVALGWLWYLLLIAVILQGFICNESERAIESSYL